MGFCGPLETGAQVPEFGEKLDLEHPAQVGDTAGAAGAAFEADDPFDGGHMVEAPAAEVILKIDELFGQFVQFPMRVRGGVDLRPGGLDPRRFRPGLRKVAGNDFGRAGKASARKGATSFC